MIGTIWIQSLIFLVILILLVKPLGEYMARVYRNERTLLDALVRPIERWIYRAAGVNADEEMDWKTYALAMLVFNALGLFAVYALERAQGFWLFGNCRDRQPVMRLFCGKIAWRMTAYVKNHGNSQ